MKIRPIRQVTLAILLISAALGAEGGQSMNEILTPPEVWRGFDPREEPLEEEVIREWSVGVVGYKEVYFTAWKHGDEKVRIYAIYAARRDKGRLPAVVHVHGGGQTVNVNWLRFWSDRGYAALTYNWGGAWPNRDRYALYGSLKQGNHRDAGDTLRATEPSVRLSSWYIWTKVSSRTPEQFEIAVYKNHFVPGQEKYIAKVSIEGGSGWCEVSLSPAQFARDDGTDKLDSWNALTTLQLERPKDGWKDENIVFTNF